MNTVMYTTLNPHEHYCMPSCTLKLQCQNYWSLIAGKLPPCTAHPLCTAQFIVHYTEILLTEIHTLFYNLLCTVLCPTL